MAPQRHLYLEDTYAFEVSAKVVGVSGDGDSHQLVLSPNIFHPQGGGQPRDRGVVNGSEVLGIEALGDGAVIAVRCAGGGAPDLGDLVQARVEPEVRRLHAALHTAGHVVDAVVCGLGYEHKSSNHFPGEARVEFQLKGAKPDLERLRDEVTERAEAVIHEDLAVRAVSSPDGRIVEIGSLHAGRCAGTHVSRLAALGGFSIRSLKAKGKVLKVGYDARHERGPNNGADAVAG